MTQDAAEARAAFLERRPPRFIDRWRHRAGPLRAPDPGRLGTPPRLPGLCCTTVLISTSKL